MKTVKIQDITFDTEDAITAVALKNVNEMIMLLSSGVVVCFNLEERKGQKLFSVESHFTYEDGGFDPKAKSTIYTLDEIVVVVNDFKRHGIIHYPDNYDTLRLWRKDDKTGITNYPIALFKNDNGVPNLIYGVDWNHIQILNLDTRQILTADKSLIEENAEQRHISFYENREEESKYEWPTPYDYFYGKLFMSPNQKKFISAGWIWGSNDNYNIYDIDNFLSTHRISCLNIGGWEHEDRGVCWIDDATIAVTYNPLIDDDEEENTDRNRPIEIHFYKIHEDKVVLDRKVQVSEKNIFKAKLYFDPKINSLISLSEKSGLHVISLNGEILYQDENLNGENINFNLELSSFIKIEDKTVSIFKLMD